MEQVIELDTTWAISGLMNTNSLRVIAYAQDLNSRLIYQATFVDVPLTLENPLSVNEPLATLELYPNPSDEQFTLEFAETLIERTSWSLYDQTGKMVIGGLIEPGTKSTVVDTRNLPAGLYLIQLFGGNSASLTRRVLVIH